MTSISKVVFCCVFLCVAFSAISHALDLETIAATGASSGKLKSKPSSKSTRGKTVAEMIREKKAGNQKSTSTYIPQRKLESALEVVKAKRIEIVDSNGRARITLKCFDDVPSIEMTDYWGSTSFQIVSLLDSFIKIGVTADKKCSLEIAHNKISLMNGKSEYASLELKDDGKPSFTLWYPNGHSSATVEMTKDGYPRILAWNKDGTACAPIIIGQETAGATSETASSSRRPLRIPVVSGVYVAPGGGHWIDSVTDNGNIVILEDDSTWEISPLDRVDTSLWLSTSDIVVTDSNNPAYPYRLINKDDNETAEAKLISD